MESITILSCTWETEEKVISDLIQVAEKAGFEYLYYSRPEMYMTYSTERQSLLWDTYSQEQYEDWIKKYGDSEPAWNNDLIVGFPKLGRDLYRLAIADDTDSSRMIFEFAKEYLRLNPDKILYEEWSQAVITLEDVKAAEEQGGYSPGWYGSRARTTFSG